MNRVQYRTNYVRNTHNPYCTLISLCMCILNLEGNQMTLDLPKRCDSDLNRFRVKLATCKDSSLIRLPPCEATFKQHTKSWRKSDDIRPSNKTGSRTNFPSFQPYWRGDPITALAYCAFIQIFVKLSLRFYMNIFMIMLFTILLVWRIIYWKHPKKK
jgi:hypothetical protein